MGVNKRRNQDHVRNCYREPASTIENVVHKERGVVFRKRISASYMDSDRKSGISPPYRKAGKKMKKEKY